MQTDSRTHARAQRQNNELRDRYDRLRLATSDPNYVLIFPQGSSDRPQSASHGLTSHQRVRASHGRQSPVRQRSCCAGSHTTAMGSVIDPHVIRVGPVKSPPSSHGRTPPAAMWPQPAPRSPCDWAHRWDGDSHAHSNGEVVMDDAWNRPITAASQVAPNRLLGDAAHAAGASAAPRGPASPLSFDNLPVEMKVRRQPIMRPNCLTPVTISRSR